MVIVLNVETTTQNFKKHGELRTNDTEICDLPNKEFKKLFENIQGVVRKQ